MGVISRSLEQGLAIAKKGGGGVAGMGKTITSAMKPDSIKAQPVIIDETHWPDAEHGDTVQGKMMVGEDGTRSVSPLSEDDSKKNLMDSIAENNNSTYNYDNEA